jgi:hypothetical protein
MKKKQYNCFIFALKNLAKNKIDKNEEIIKKMMNFNKNQKKY